MKNINVKIIQIALNNAQHSRDLGRDSDAIQQLITAVRAMFHAELEEEYHRYIAETGEGYNYEQWLWREKQMDPAAARQIAG